MGHISIQVFLSLLLLIWMYFVLATIENVYQLLITNVHTAMANCNCFQYC